MYNAFRLLMFWSADSHNKHNQWSERGNTKTKHELKLKSQTSPCSSENLKLCYAKNFPYSLCIWLKDHVNTLENELWRRNAVSVDCAISKESRMIKCWFLAHFIFILMHKYLADGVRMWMWILPCDDLDCHVWLLNLAFLRLFFEWIVLHFAVRLLFILK